MHRIRRKTVAFGAAGLLSLAGIAGVAGHNAVHAAGTPPAIRQTAAEPSSTAPDTDRVQQEVQSGSQQDLGAADTAEAAASTQPDTDNVQSQSQTDTP
ncbi:MAG: hypothetical protein ACR2JC_13610 [Chloroflexota bacterium]|nr:MAG: hypothetical protein DLM70_07630 [Chloroflexota bacterium]